MKDFLLATFFILATVVLLFVMPVAFIWSVNTLFGFSIPFDLKHLFASWVLLFVIRIATRTEVKKD